MVCPIVCPIVASEMLLLQRCDVIENKIKDNNAAVSFVEKFTVTLNIGEWNAHV